jgi:hypothetical protein
MNSNTPIFAVPMKREWDILNEFFCTPDYDAQAIVNYVSPFMMLEDEVTRLKKEIVELKKEIEELKK